jgi:hypothetical protein
MKLQSIWRHFIFGTSSDYLFVQRTCEEFLSRYGNKVPQPTWVRQLASVRLPQNDAQAWLAGLMARGSLIASSSSKEISMARKKKVKAEAKKEARKEAKKEVKKEVKKEIKKAAPAKRGGAASGMAAANAVELDNDRAAAWQILHCDRVIKANKLTDAPVADTSPVVLISSEVQYTVAAIDDTAGQVGYLRILAQPRPVNHVATSSSSNNGVPTGWAYRNIQGQSSLSTTTDDMRCAGIAIAVKYAGTEQYCNGICRTGSLNPNGAWAWDPASVNPEETVSYPPSPMHYSVTPWIPVRPEADFAFVAYNNSTATDNSVVWWEWTGNKSTSSPLPTFSVTVYSVWAIRPLANVVLLAEPKIYLNSQDGYEKFLMLELSKKPLWTQARIMYKDDGPLDLIPKLFNDGKNAYNAGSKLFGSDSSITERLGGAVDLVKSLGSIGSSFMSFFTVEELALRRLGGLTTKELLFIAEFLHKNGPDPKKIDRAINRQRASRLHRTTSRRTYWDAGEVNSDDEEETERKGAPPSLASEPPQSVDEDWITARPTDRRVTFTGVPTTAAPLGGGVVVPTRNRSPARRTESSAPSGTPLARAAGGEF